MTMDRFGFVHIHKTGGASVRTMCEANFAEHEIYEYGREFQLVDRFPQGKRFFRGHISRPAFRELVPDIRLFTFVRDPIPRFVSAYYYFRNMGRRKLAAKKKPDRIPSSQLKLAGMTLWEALTTQDDDIRNSLDNVQAKIIAGGRFGDRRATRNQVFLKGITDPKQIADLAMAGLEEFEIVGILEKMPESLARIGEAFQWRFNGVVHINRSTTEQFLEHEREVEEYWDLLERRTALDRIVYHAALNRL